MARKCENCIHDKVCNMWALDSGIPFVNADTCEHYKPAADVVPKSEVERLQKERDEYRKHVDNDIIYVHRIRAEVARKIFEEIETCMKDFEDDDDGYLLKKCEFEFFMREIRDKYTESENGRANSEM